MGVGPDSRRVPLRGAGDVVRPPREIAHKDENPFCAGLGHDRMCDRDTRMLALGMIEALRWVLPHVWPDMRAEVSAKLAELEKP